MTRVAIDTVFRATLTWAHGAQDAVVVAHAGAHYPELAHARPSEITARSAERVPPALLRALEAELAAAVAGPGITVEVAPRPPRPRRAKLRP